MAGLAAIVLALGALLPGCASRGAERRAPPLGAFIEVKGERLHVLDLGPRDSAAPPVVLIHGASVNLRDMKIALGDRLAETRRVILIDRPGRGYSTRPGDGWRLETQAALIHGAVQALGAERPIVVGQSLGGAVALAYALAYQDEMTGLVLLAPVSHEWPGGVAWYNSASGWPIAGSLLRRLVIPLYGPAQAKSGVPSSFAPDAPPADYYEASGLELLFRPHDFKANAEDLAKLKPQIVAMSGRYGALALPVVIMTGNADRTVSPQLHSLALAEEIDGAKLTVFEGVGHALHHARAGEVVEAVEGVGR